MNVKRNNIKKIISAAAIAALAVMLLLTMSSCITIKLNSLKGSGEVVSEDFDVSGFNKLSFSGIGKIIIKQSAEESLTIEAEKNIIDALDINVSGNRLNIGLKRGFLNIIPTKDIIFHLNVIDIQKIDLTGAGSVICENLETESLEINSSGLGNIEFYIEAENLETEISGAGKVIMAGKVDRQEIEVSGVGTYNGKELQSNECLINISGAGRAIVNVLQILDVKMSGVGNVEYTGNPQITQNISGIGGTVKSID
jgi:hypothetical protein